MDAPSLGFTPSVSLSITPSSSPLLFVHWIIPWTSIQYYLSLDYPFDKFDFTIRFLPHSLYINHEARVARVGRSDGLGRQCQGM
jgi:hypothetical protein